MTDIAWIGVDWGTTNMRAWAVGRDGQIHHSGHSGKGMGVLAPSGFETALVEVIGGWLGQEPVPVIICGMAGSRQGWVEAPYETVPCPPPKVAQAVRVETEEPRLDVRILPGIKQVTPPDVMRGEETQIAGFLAGHPGWDGVLCLPGTHSKWAQISAGEVVSFRTFMTGELFSLLAAQSVLRHSLHADKEVDGEAFDAAIADAMAKPEALAGALFAIRAQGLVATDSASAARGRLSGLLIGAELAAARPYWLGQDIAIIGEDSLAQHYQRALAGVGVTARLCDATAMTLAGLGAGLAAGLSAAQI